MAQQMGIINLTGDSFWGPSRVSCVQKAIERMLEMQNAGAAYVDIGAVSSRPGAEEVPLEEEWRRLRPTLEAYAASKALLPKLSVDTTRAEIVRRTYAVVGEFIVNDISSGEDDSEMLEVVAERGLSYIAMHKRGNPRTMDALTDYPEGVVAAVRSYFEDFQKKAQEFGIREWILDPGFGFAKTQEQNWELLEGLSALHDFGRPILVGMSHKRFCRGREQEAIGLALSRGADILRVHEIIAEAQLPGIQGPNHCH